MLVQQVKELPNAAWLSSIKLLTNINKSLRFCAYYRGLNFVIVCCSYSNTELGKLINTLSHEKLCPRRDFSIIDGRTELDEDGKGSTVSEVQHELTRYKLVCLNIKIDLAIFQSIISAMLSTLKNLCVLVFLHVFVLLSRTSLWNLENAATVLKIMKRASSRWPEIKTASLKTSSTALT